MEALKESLRPRPRPRIQTGKKTLRNRVVWSDETSEDPYSEITYTVPWGEGYAVIPTVDANGNKLSVPEALEKTFDKKLLTSSRNPLDFVTGEELPVFSTEEEANRYAQWRSDTMFDAEAIAEGFEIAPTQIFPDAPPPEVDNRSITNKVINKLNRFLAYTGVKSYKGEIEGFDEGGLTDQMEMFGYTAEGVQQEVDKYVPEPSKGLSYSELILDSIIGLENNYETNVEGIVKQFNQDKMGFLETIAKSIYEETVDFIKAPVELPLTDKKLDPTVASVNPTLKAAEFTTRIANELKEAVTRLSSQDLSTRLQGMFDVDYNNATDDQVSKARESVLGDALIVGEFIAPLRPLTRTISKAVPGGVKADVIGTYRSLASGDPEMIREQMSYLMTPESQQPKPKGVGANVPGMFPERVEEPDVEFDAEELEFYELEDKFIDIGKNTVNFTEAFSLGPSLINLDFNTAPLITSDEIYINLENLGIANQRVPVYNMEGHPEFGDELRDEQYNKFMETAEGIGRPGGPDTYDPQTGQYNISANSKLVNLTAAVKPEYFAKVREDIAESIRIAFKENINNVEPSDVFKLIGLIRKNKEIDVDSEEYLTNPERMLTEQNVIRNGIDETLSNIVTRLKLTDNIVVTDPRIYERSFGSDGQLDQIELAKMGGKVVDGSKIKADLTPRMQYINVDTQQYYYEKAIGKNTDEGIKYPFSSVFGVEPKDTGMFYNQGDGMNFTVNLQYLLKEHFNQKLTVDQADNFMPGQFVEPSLKNLDTIAGKNLEEVSEIYANQFIKEKVNSVSNIYGKKSGEVNLTKIAGDVFTELFEKTNKKVIPGGTILKTLQEDSRVNNTTIPPYFLSDQFKNRVFKSDDWTDLLLEYGEKSPTITYDLSQNRFPDYQRQASEFGGTFYGGEVKNYKELVISAKDYETGVAPFSTNLSHFGPGIIAHTRVSTIDPRTSPKLENLKGLEQYNDIIGKEPFKLVDEAQSDLYSKGIQKFKKIEVTPDTVKNIFYRHEKPSEPTFGSRNYNRRFPAFSANQDLIEKYGIDNYELNPEKGEEVFETVAAALEDIANQPDGKDVVMAKEKFDELTKKTVDEQELKYKDLSISEKFETLFNSIIQQEYMTAEKFKDRIISGDISNKELAAEMNDGFRYKNFLLAYNDFKRNGTIPNNPDILEDVKDLYMDNLSSDYKKYLNNFISNPGSIDYDEKFNPDGIKDFSGQSFINSAAIVDPKRFQDAPIKLKGKSQTKVMEDYVSLIVQRLINDAYSDGIDNIVFPNVEKILERRFRGEELKYALQNKSFDSDTGKISDGHPLYKSYGIVLSKVLDKFEKVYDIKIHRDITLPYDNMSGRDLSKKGTIINISNMKDKFDLSRPAFAEGGTIMNKQMEMAFMKQGGIKDDGMNKDPVSGNNIPPGSMAEEVRDDVPAMLSEGEYVVPADVLRFYGVNFFEDLRNKAKNGLQTMEQNGRIGGTPLSDQDVARNMQQPMMSPQPPQASNTAQPQQQMMANQGMMVQGFDNGTAQVLPNITSQYASSFSPATARYSSPMFQGTSSQLANVATAQAQTAAQEITTMVTHYDKDGNQMQVKYVSVGNAQPKPADGQQDILKQYNMNEVQYAEYKKTQNQSQGSDKKPNPFDKPKVDKIGPLVNIGAMDAVGVQEWATETLKETDLQKVTSPFGPIVQSIGYGEQARRIAEVRAMAKYRTSLGGADNIALAATLNGQADALINNPGLKVLDALGLMSGEGIYQDMIGYTPGQSQPSLPNASNGQTVPYMFTDDNGNPLTASNYQFAEALAGTYGWEARHFAVQQQASMMLNDKGIEDNTYYGGGTQSNDVTVADDPSGGETQTIVPSGGPGTFPVSDNTSPATAEQIATATQTSEAANANVDFTPGTDLGTDEDVQYDDTFYNEGGLMAAPKKKKKRQPKKGGLAGKK